MRDRSDDFSPGALIGRYMVLGRLGAGGMGVVYSAYDPELDRKVAIKVLRRGARADEAARARLVREAQAMARLVHPNVITVHDVGTVDDQVFVAMEYVQGSTLRGWLRAERRPWREVVSIFVRAGRGLAAAHEAGLVHRDFKPDNVLVGVDGRVRVTDFGLARAEGGDGTPAFASPELDLDHALTETGNVVGTPAYMPPEQMAGKLTDARGDQFSFCVGLYEGLYGKRPFPGSTLSEIAEALERRGPEEPPRDSKVPPGIRRLVQTGLRSAPGDRHPSMTSLLDGLERALAGRRLGTVIAVGLLAAAGLAALALLRPPPPVCTGAAEALGNAWDAARSAAAAAAFDATGHPKAREVFAQTSATLDAYAASWTQMHTEACQATRVHRSQSEEALEARMTCLDSARLSLASLGDVLVKIDGAGVDKALNAARALAPLRTCADVALLLEKVRPPRDPALRARVAALRGRLVALKTLIDFGRFADAEPEARAAVEEGRALAYRPMEAEADYLAGRVFDSAGKLDDAETALRDAVVAGLAGRHDMLVVGALSYQSYVVGNRRNRFAEAEVMLRQAEAILERMTPDPELMANLANARGNLAGAQDKFDEAYRHHQRALDLWRPILGDDNPRMGVAYGNVGQDLRRLGKLKEALEADQKAQAVWQKAYGPEHPYLVDVTSSIGLIYADLMDLEKALAQLQLALRLAEKVYGPEHDEVASVENNLGATLDDFGKFEEALPHFQRALTIREKTEGPDSEGAASQRNNIGNVLQKQGHFAEALPMHQRALADMEKALGKDSPRLAMIHNNIASACLGLGQPAIGLPHAERALALFDDKNGEGMNQAEFQFTLAQTLAKLGRDRPRALVLGHSAAETFAKGGVRDEEELAAVRAWLAEMEK